MNRFIALFFVFFAVHSFQAFSQNNITIGQPYRVIDALTKEYFVEKGEIFAVKRLKKKSVVIQKMDANTLAFKQIRTYDGFPKVYGHDLKKFGGRYFFFYTHTEDRAQKLDFREIDLAKGTFKSGHTLLEVDDKEVANNGSYTSISPIFSYDTTMMAIIYRHKPKTVHDSKSFDKVTLHVFNDQLKQLWTNTVTMPYTEKKMDFLYHTVDYKGNVHFVTRVYNDDSTDEKKRGDDNANYSIEILKASAGSNDLKSAKVALEDKFIKTIGMYETPDHQLLCAGYYNDGKSGSAIDGLFRFKMSPDGRLSGHQYYEIPLAILNQNVSKREQRKNEKKEEKGKAQAYRMALEDIVIESDGSMLIVGEENYSITRTTTTGGGGGAPRVTSSHTTYYSQDILATKIDANGKLSWMKKIPKDQRGASSWSYNGMSFMLATGTDNHYFCYLDNQKNLDLPDDEVPATHIDGQGGFFMVSRIQDRTGAVEKKSLLDSRNIKGMEVYQFKPSRIIVLNSHTLVFEVYKKKKEDVLIRVTLD